MILWFVFIEICFVLTIGFFLFDGIEFIDKIFVLLKFFLDGQLTAAVG